MSKDDMTTDLLPCPFCGSTKVDVCAAKDGHNPPLCVMCEECWARGQQGATDLDAIIRWNRRTAAVAPVILPEEFEKLAKVYSAARSLCFGVDWNNGTMAKFHGYRQQLIDAVHAVEPLPDCACRPAAERSSSTIPPAPPSVTGTTP